VPRRRGYDVDDEIQSVIALPPASTLARRAQREQELGRDNEPLTTTSGRYALLGPTILKRCQTACATVENELFAVSGLLKDHDALPARAAAVLDVRVGHGARFLLARNVARGVPFSSSTSFPRRNHPKQDEFLRPGAAFFGNGRDYSKARRASPRIHSQIKSRGFRKTRSAVFDT
jgi:hypothetical protein